MTLTRATYRFVQVVFAVIIITAIVFAVRGPVVHHNCTGGYRVTVSDDKATDVRRDPQRCGR